MMKMEISIAVDLPDDRHEAFVFTLSEKLEELVRDGWDICTPVIACQETSQSIKTRYLMLSNRMEVER